MRAAVSDRYARLREFTAPFGFVVRFLLPCVRGRVLGVAVLGVIGAVCNALGLLMLMPLIAALTGGRDELTVRSLRIPLDHTGLLVLFGVAVLLVFAAMQLRLMIQARAFAVMDRAAEEASIRGLLRLRELAARAPEAGLERHVASLVGRVSFGCGFLMRQFANSLADLMRFAVFLAALTWLSPWLSLLLVVSAAAALSLYSRSVSRVASMAEARKETAVAARGETREVRELFDDASAEPDDLRRRLEGFFERGALGEAMRQRGDLRREMRRGPLLIEGLFPLLLVMFVVLALATDVLSSQAAPLLVSVILIRGLIGQMQKLGSLFIATGRFHAPLLFYMQLHTTDDPAELVEAEADEALDEGE